MIVRDDELAAQAARQREFARVYTEELARAVEAFPDEYPWAREDTIIVGNLGRSTIPRQTVEAVAAKMLDAVARGTFNKDGRAIRATCKRLGIKHTYKAIRAYRDGAA